MERESSYDIKRLRDLPLWLSTCLIHVKVYGPENLPAPGDDPVIYIIGPHRGHYDTPAFLAGLPPELRKKIAMGAKGYYWKKPLRRCFLGAFTDSFLIDSTTYGGDVGSLAIEKRIWARGKSIGLFGEGGRSNKQWGERRLRLSGAALALGAGMDVIPVVLGGHLVMSKETALPKLFERDERGLHKKTIRVYYGERIHVDQLDEESAKDIKLLVHHSRLLTNRIWGAMSRMVLHLQSQDF